MYCCHLDTPIGRLMLVGDGDRLHEIRFPNADHEPALGWRTNAAALDAPRRQLDAYFEGRRKTFDLQLDWRGTAFQVLVLRALTQIPYGSTRSYGAIAQQIGRPKAVRAVGAANARNPIPIVVPCHRVIGADGQLTGFGGGIDTKAVLLRHEAQVLSAAA
ncbi:MAG: methylated-DNA--[protein]-cysteine S-methyltransferase [Pseudomonadota bacterium]|nr:methylated-DNA--[protein]-cysteine S-methyltransferase [Pseudomonadota bacterium]